MKDTFIICHFNNFTKNTSIDDVTDDIKEAYYIANTEKQDNKNDTYWIEGWNKSGMFAKFEEETFMD